MGMTGKNPKSSSPHSSVDFTVAVLGGGTGAPTVPADGKLTPSTSTYPVRGNKVSTATADAPTRSSAGVYVITYADFVPFVKNAWASVVSAGGSPTGDLQACVTKIDAANRQLTVKTATFAGVATDIGTNDMLIITVDAQDSTV